VDVGIGSAFHADGPVSFNRPSRELLFLLVFVS